MNPKHYRLHSGLFLFSIVFCIQAKASEVRFKAIGKPAMLQINAKCSKSGFNLDGNKLAGWVEIDSCDTGIQLRNRHMKEKYLKVAEHPRSELTATLPNTDGSFTGELTVSGKKSPVEGNVQTIDGKRVVKFSTLISSHGIEVPSFSGITVANKVEIEAVL